MADGTWQYTNTPAISNPNSGYQSNLSWDSAAGLLDANSALLQSLGYTAGSPLTQWQQSGSPQDRGIEGTPQSLVDLLNSQGIYAGEEGPSSGTGNNFVWQLFNSSGQPIGKTVDAANDTTLAQMLTPVMMAVGAGAIGDITGAVASQAADASGALAAGDASGALAGAGDAAAADSPYSLSSLVTPTQGGLSVVPSASDSLDLAGSASSGLQLPTSPNIVGLGSQGITVPTAGGALGQYGVTPTGSSPILGSASSFINNPDTLGQSVVGGGTPDSVASGPSINSNVSNLLNALASPQSATQAGQSSQQPGAALPGLGASRYLTPTEMMSRGHGALNFAPQLRQMRALAPGTQNMNPQLLNILLARSAMASGMKDGGSVEPRHPYEQPGVPLFRTGGSGRHVQGPGDGQSDDIPAMLADGEYVWDADTVSALGNGSNKAGAAVLDRMREEIREHKRSAPVDKIPPKAKSPLTYLKKARS